MMRSVIKNGRMYLKLLIHPDTPWYIKTILAAALIYLLFPADLVPDWLIGLGIIDDFIVVSSLVGLAVKLLKKQNDNMGKE